MAGSPKRNLRSATVSIAFVLVAAPQMAGQGTMTTFAGTEWVFGGDGKPALSAPLGGVNSVTLDASGNLVFSDPDNGIVARLNASGLLTVIAGNGLQGYSGDGGAAINASLNYPQGVAYDSKGNLYIADQINCRIRKVTPSGVITTVAGTGIEGISGNGGPALEAKLYQPLALAIDSADNIYFSDNSQTQVRRIDPNGIISLVAGNPQSNTYAEGGPALQAYLSDIEDIAAAPKGILYLADFFNHAVRKVDTNTGIITTVAGIPGKTGYSGDNGPATRALLNSPGGVTVDISNNIYISDTNNYVIRKIDTSGTITTFAGSGKFGFSADGPAANAAFRAVYGLAVDKSNNLYAADSDNHRIRRVTSGFVATVAGSGIDGAGTFRYFPDRTPAANAYLFEPNGLSFDSSGNLLVADTFNNRIRKITTGGLVSTIAGNGARECCLDGGPAVSAVLAGPASVTAAASGNIYITDSDNNRIRRIAPNGVITTVAGNNFAQFSGDGGPATQASLDGPQQVVVDSSENLYIADTFNNRVRRVSNGIISTIAGNGRGTYAGDNGAATSASLSWPNSLALDAAGNNLYIADNLNGRIRKVSFLDGTISTVAGGGSRAVTAGSSFSALQAQIARPRGLTLDGGGNLYVSDGATNQVYRLSTVTGNITLAAGNGATAFSGDGGPSTLASLNEPNGLAVDSSGSLFIADVVNNRVRQILTAPLTLLTSAASLAFSAKSGGPLTDVQSVAVSTVIGGTPGPAVPYSLTVSTTDGGNWLTASVGTNSTNPNMPALGATTPSTIQAVADPSSLDAGKTYQGSIKIAAPGATPPVTTLNVSITLDPAVPPVLGLSGAGLDPDPNKIQGNTVSGALTASVLQGGQPVSQSLSVLNSGGGILSFSATATTANGAGWLSVSLPGSATATPVQPGAVTVQLDPTGLTPGTYTGAVTVASDTAGTLQAAVILTVAAIPRKLLLSQVGLTFTAVSGGGAPLDQTFAVLNAGQGTLNWTVQAKTLGGGKNWLLVNPAAGSGGSSTAGSSIVPLVDVAVDASLDPGEYYGQIQIVSPDADNSPQTVTIVLDVKPPGFDPGPDVQPAGLVFTGAAGSVPGSQTVFISNLTAGSITYSSSVSTEDATNWFVAAPTNATLATTQLKQPARIVVQPDFSNLAAGIYNGTLRLAFGGLTRTVAITAVVGGGGSQTAAARPIRAHKTSASACANGLNVTLSSPQSGFSLVATKPVNIQATVVDACTQGFITPTSGTAPPPDVHAVVTIGGQSTKVPLNYTGNGIWQSSWQPPNGNPSQVTLYVNALEWFAGITSPPKGTSPLISGTLTPPPPDTPPTPSVKPAVQNSASLVSTPLIAPGGLISMFGQDLVDSTSADACSSISLGPPLPTQLAGAQIYLGDRALAISYACGTQINAQIPYDLAAVDISGAGLFMQRTAAGTTAQSVQVPVSTASTQPAIFTVSQTGQGQGIIDNVAPDGTTARNGPGSAAKPGQTVIIYCAGLGAVAPAVGLGAPGPSAPPALPQNPVQVTIGGQPAQLAASPQLTPNSAGLYQVPVIVPQNATTGDQVQVILTVLGQSSPPVTMAVQQ